MTVRAKFLCSMKSIASSTEKGQTGNVELTPVYSDNKEHENRQFWEATPSGHIKMSINNPAGFARFDLGQEYYVDFTPAT